MMTNGFGATIGTLAAQAIVNHFVNSEAVQAAGPMAIWQGWQTSWYIFAAFALVVSLAFWVIFPKTPVKK
jgi:NHS family nucleoside permease-like MFS transporter/NHS family xanthosine MFS transporter